MPMVENIPDHAREADRLLRSTPMVSLSTLDREIGAAPYASLQAVAVDHDGGPILLMSQLSDHTKNLQADPRAALLFDGSGGHEHRMAGPRLTVQGRIEADEQPAHRVTRYLSRHPGAEMYHRFGDFGWYRMTVERAHLVGGFSQAFWLAGEDLIAALPESYGLIAAEPEILEHMNQDHMDAVQLYASGVAGAPKGDWRMTAVDGFGFDLGAHNHILRIPFDEPAETADDVRRLLIKLARTARSQAHSQSA
ncbi:MAG: HugZ family protein [Geminicoccaceae bacterium]